MWDLACSHGTKIMGSHPAPQNFNKEQLSFLWSQQQIQRPDPVFGLLPSVPCLEDSEALSALLQLGKLLSKMRVPDIQPNTLLTKPHGLFSSALPWTTRLFLTQAPLIPFPGYTPTCSQSQVLLGMWLFLECSVTLELWPLIPEQEDLRRQIPTTRDQCESPSPQAGQRLWFSTTAFCCAQLTGSRNPSLQTITLLHYKPSLELTKAYGPLLF